MSSNIEAKDKNKDKPLNYSIECAGSASQGYYLVKVSAYVSKSSEISNDIVMRSAVHGVLFKGFSGRDGCVSQRPLAGSTSVEQEKADYFNAFFNKEKAYSSYANVIPESMQTEKVGKQYKVTAIVNVAKDLLYKALTKAGIIKGLNNGF